MRKLKNSKGQMRVVETILASLVIVFALAFVNIFAVTPYSAKYETSDLEKWGHNVLHDLEEKMLLTRFVYREEWANLTTALMVSLPSNVYFNLTVFDLNGNVVNDAPICHGDSQIFVTATMSASVQYIVPGYQINYNPRILLLQLVRG